jgi:glucosamine--fructose-6-phosphate aminotransferase (isomerizing)
MCGIVGYIGRDAVTPLLLQGLSKLEYRGYDSSGIAVLKDGEIVLHKKEGKIVGMASTVPDYMQTKDINIGISHTRWATHGKPTTNNAHPHVSNSGNIAIVHNGIIENYESLKTMLKQKGYTFYSETDTEVLCNLIDMFLVEEHSFINAIKQALKTVVGTYGIIVMHRSYPDRLVVARNSSPIIIGVGADEMIIASDPSAIIPRTQRVIYLDDGEIALVKKDDISVCDLHNIKKTKAVEKLEFELSEIEKGDYKHFMLKEIHEQPLSIGRAFHGRIRIDDGTASLSGLRLTNRDILDIERICIIACGTAYYAGCVGKYMIESMARIPVDIDVASEFRYRNPMINKNTLYIVVSQSGETADTLASLREIQRKGGHVVAISNVVGSTIAREAGRGVYIHAGPEISVASTKAFTSQVTTFFLLALQLGRVHDMDYTTGSDYVKALDEIPEKIKELLEQEIIIKALSTNLINFNNFIFIGRGIHFPVALEGALKLKEISYLQAEAFPAGELKHGPLALVDEKTAIIAIIPKDDLFEKTISNIREAQSRGGYIVVVTDEDSIKGIDALIQVPTTVKMLSPLLSVISLQLLAYYMAILKECNIDQPRNLAKSVTVE